MTRNTGWGSSSSPTPPSRSTGWSQDFHKPGDAKPVLQGVETPQMREDAFVAKHRPTLVKLFGEDFANNDRYKEALAKVLEGRRAVHLILADYRPRERKTGGSGW